MARFEAPEPWKDADRKQFLPRRHERDTFKTERDELTDERDTLKTERDALKTEVDWLEKLTGKAAKTPASGGGGDKKLTADEWRTEELKKVK